MKKCSECGKYTLKGICDCGGKAEEAGYKFVRIKDVEKRK